MPKGTSSYQAAWIEDAPIVNADDDDEDLSSDESYFDDNMKVFGSTSILSIVAVF